MSSQYDENFWNELKRHTEARINLGRCGGSLPTKEWVRFKFDHARARDAVNYKTNLKQLSKDLLNIGVHTFEIQSAASDAKSFLLRPDLGRSLSDTSRTMLTTHGAIERHSQIAVVASAGLSGLALEAGLIPLLRELKVTLSREKIFFNQVFLCQWGRVALADEVGETLGVKLVLNLIGERPGLLNADSLGAYLTYAPKRGRHDGERNCVSNIRDGGLSFAEAATRITWLAKHGLGKQLTGVNLKEESSIHSAVPTRHDAFVSPPLPSLTCEENSSFEGPLADRTPPGSRIQDEE